jgi:uncharacterized protein YbjT (DUF2867 family)
MVPISQSTPKKAIRTVAVTGASGFVGRHIVRELLASRFEVRALVRSRDKAREVLGADLAHITTITGDVNDPAALKDLLQGADACIHLIGILREVRTDAANSQTFRKAHVLATQSIVNACEAAGVQRYIHMSALGVQDDGISDYQRSKWEAERTVMDSSLDWTIFRPGLIHGAGSEFMEMAIGWTSGLEQPWIFIPYFTRGDEDKTTPLGGARQIDPVVAPVFVEDVAKAFVLALTNDKATQEIYNLAGSETLSWPAMLTKIRDEGPGGNPSLRPFGIPAQVAAIQAKAAKFVGLGKFLPFDEGMALMGGQDSVADTTKVREQLGLSTRGFSETFAKYAGSL